MNITERRFVVAVILLLSHLVGYSQQPSKVREYEKVFRTYPFSDPDPVPDMTKIYPYFRYDGYTDQPIDKKWKVVELENDYIKVMILPEIGGKIWAAIEKSTGKSFIYYNQVVKFRDVAMRGPWTSGGIEANYGIVGHTPNCATPVDYIVIPRADGSVSCVIGVLDLLTRSTWRIDINLPKDKAYFTTSSTWYNSAPFEQPYYTWMNTGLKAKGNLQFIYPGTKYIGHAGEYSDWPIDKQGRDLSFYENNNFGEYKSYHVFGKYTGFFGGYYHDEDFGMARYSTHDDKAGKKIWIWGLSRQGMIWEKLLTDNDGQYVEVQSGRLFNQPAEGSSFTPFKNRSFIPNTTDTWTEYWFPVLKTKGFVTANNYGALNVKKTGKKLVIYFSPVQPVQDELKITEDGKVIYSKKLNLKTLELFTDSLNTTTDIKNVEIKLGGDKLVYESSPDAGKLTRPVETPADFDWNSVQGLYLQGKELIRQRMYTPAEEKLKAALKADPNYLPALADQAMLQYRQMKYDAALDFAKRALAIDTYDPAANYYYGLTNEKLGNNTDAKDGYDIASQSAEYRSAAFTRLAGIYFRENEVSKAKHYAWKSIESNKLAIDAYEFLAVIYRGEGKKDDAAKILDTLLMIDPLNHFAYFEKYLLANSEKNKDQFTSLIQNEMPSQTYLELAIWYYNAGLKDDAVKVLEMSKPDAEVSYWHSFLTGKPVDTKMLQPGLLFPFRHETADVLEKLITANDHWLLKYHLALIRWNSNNEAAAKQLFEQIGDQPDYAPYYAVRAKLYAEDSAKSLADMQKAESLDKNQWRYSRSIVNYYLSHDQPELAASTAAAAYKRFPSNYILGMLYAKSLIADKQYPEADQLLQKLSVLPNEGATVGRQLYREAKIMLALKNMKASNYKKALQYLSESKLWPERLGSGKPYQDDIDERVEDWLSYECLVKMKNNASAKQMLDKILSYRRTGHGSVNDLISAWAYEKAGRREEGVNYLKETAGQHPDNVVAKWLLDYYNGNHTAAPSQAKKNDNYQILEEAGLIK